MYALVKFYDNVYYVRKSKDIVITKNIIKCKYSDGRAYPSTVIARNGKLEYSYIWLFIDIYANLLKYIIMYIFV